MDFRERIVMIPEVRFGKAVVKGTRLTVGEILGYLAAGDSPEGIVEEFPQLGLADVRACLAYAATKEHLVLGL